jgi:CheY-like chemotaxis protein
MTHDQGTAIIIDLADARNEQRARASLPAVAEKRARHAGRQQRILVADDDPLVRATIRRILENAGFDVASARDGCEASDRLRCEGFDVAIIDIFMPNQDGLEVIRRLRGAEAPALIAISGGAPLGRIWHLDSEIDFLEAAKAFGAATTLCKPFGRAQLLTAVRDALGDQDGSAEAGAPRSGDPVA